MVLGLGHHAHEAEQDEPRGRPIGTGRGGAGNVRLPLRAIVCALTPLALDPLAVS